MSTIKQKNSKKIREELRGVEALLRHWREDVPNDRIAHLVRDTARGLTRALQVRLAVQNVSFGHWVFLRILWEEEGLTQRELSDRAGLMEPTTHTAILKMEQLGYVERRQHDDNRRKLFVYLTRRGRSLKKKLVPLAEEVNEASVKGVSKKDIAITRKTLLAMVGNLSEDEKRRVEE